MRLRQRVAVKVLAPVFAADGGAVERFLREARAVVRLRNQHVVRVIDAGTADQGAPYLVMEYLDGQSLGALLSKCGRVAARDVVDYTLQALEALAEAHRAGIVHRDLKPDNLMLVRSEDGLPQVKVIDFGISKLIGPEFTIKNLTLESSFLGSPLYASPEQLRDAGTVDARTDIWSLGVVMYELLTGHPPFDARSAAALMTAICTEEPKACRAALRRPPRLKNQRTVSISSLLSVSAVAPVPLPNVSAPVPLPSVSSAPVPSDRQTPRGGALAPAVLREPSRVRNIQATPIETESPRVAASPAGSARPARPLDTANPFNR